MSDTAAGAGLEALGKLQMCGQWFSIAGVALGVMGFLLIATERHHMFKRDVYMRQKRIERD